VLSISHRAAPRFALTDQDDKSVTSSGLQGKLTLLTFLDPVCSDDCPVIANQLAQADRELGPLAQRIEIVAIDSNPLFHHVSDVEAFTTSHGLQDLANWHFVTGPVATLQDLAAAPDGTEEAYLGDGADASLTTDYARSVRDEVRRLLA
jgi:cytochrome oxidase Cu insertion factor (SCO1/SenC/PrrC family)